jgi:hypothetical protein
METSEKKDLLKAEYFKLQDFYEGFDSKIQTIKGWSVTISIAAITIGFSAKNEYIWLLASLSSLVFWIMEAKWKAFQYYHYGRIAEIEEAFKNDNYDILKPLQISNAFVYYSRNHPRKPISIMFKNWVLIPYLYTIVGCLVLFVLQYFTIYEFWKT